METLAGSSEPFSLVPMNRRFGIWVWAVMAIVVIISIATWLPKRGPNASTPPMNAPLFTDVPGKPGWRHTAHLDWKWTDEELKAERERIAGQSDLRTHHVVLGLDLAGETKPPPGYVEAQRQKYLMASMKFGSREDALATVNMIDFNHYQGIRVFVIPRSDTGDLIRSFRVGSHYDDSPEYVDRVAQRVVAVNQTVPVTITYAWPASADLVFLDPASEADCQALGELFPIKEAMTDGLEIYYNDWEPSWSEKFLAEWFHRDQKIMLWWD